MTNEMKQFLTELAELLKKHDVQINSSDYRTEFSIPKAKGAWEFFIPDFSDITHETLQELLK